MSRASPLGTTGWRPRPGCTNVCEVGAGRRRGTPDTPSALGEAEFDALYRAHVHTLLGWFQSRTYSAQAAADLCAETFATALEGAADFDPARGAPGAWLWGIAQNLLRRYQRTEAIETRARERLAIRTPHVAEDDLDLIERICDRPELEKTVAAALATLSPAVADAVRHRVLEDRPYPDVAELCGCSEVAARARVSRGLSALLDRSDLPDIEGVTR